MKSAFAALACVGLVYASCTWLGTVEDNEMCLGKAAQTGIWFIVPPATPAAVEQPQRLPPDEERALRHEAADEAFNSSWGGLPGRPFSDGPKRPPHDGCRSRSPTAWPGFFSSFRHGFTSR